MDKKWQVFMRESNGIEGEHWLNPDDEEAFDFTCNGFEILGDIRLLHLILGRHLKKDWVGDWRKCNVTVGIYHPPMAAEVPSLMADYFTNFAAMDSYTAHNQFEKIHPFRDLNGRVGRLIWLSKAIEEGYDFSIPFLQKYYYQTLGNLSGAT